MLGLYVAREQSGAGFTVVPVCAVESWALPQAQLEILRHRAY